MKHPAYYARELSDIAVDLGSAAEKEDWDRVHDILDTAEAIIYDCREAASPEEEEM